MQRGLICFLFLILTSSCGRSTDSTTSEGRLPYADAPLDTLDAFEEGLDADVMMAEEGSLRTDVAWKELTRNGLPTPGDLSFVRYTNPRFGYSIAYPDTLLMPADAVGEDRGMTFVSASGDVRMMVYAMERDSFEDLAAQYQSAVEDAEARITYRARDDDLYVVSGRRGDEVFYEKAVSDEGRITTFRMHYPAEDKAYFDALAAMISASLER